MKIRLIILTILILLISPKADAALGSWGLIVEGGKEQLVMEKGEKKWLFIQDGLTHLPVFNGLTFFSDNTVVAKVGLHTGLVTANFYGTANISVTDESGENGIIQIKVKTNNNKASPLSLLIVLLSFSFILYFIIKIKK